MIGTTKQEDRMLDFLEKHMLARSKELQAIGVAATTISRAVEAGSITRVGRGPYQLNGSAIDRNAALAEVRKQAPKAIICLVSALAFDGLTDQMPRMTWIAVGVSSWEPNFKQPQIRVVRLREPYFSGGIEKHSISGTLVQIYSIEKSLSDAFRLPKLVDRSVAIESLKSALTNR
ncbi:MAG: putative transcriptional regulator of viral defense system [Arenicella sp.]|jgi:predicted transcriptional regulator of viral defense system